MYGESTYTIVVNKEDVPVINNLLNTLDECPISLEDYDYVDIMKAIANKNANVDNDNINIIYED